MDAPDSLWRTATVEGEHIVLECPADTLEIHKADLDEDVANTNAVYRKHLVASEARAAKAAVTARGDRSLVRE